jgi:hypothetical protein
MKVCSVGFVLGLERSSIALLWVIDIRLSSKYAGYPTREAASAHSIVGLLSKGRCYGRFYFGSTTCELERV